MSEQPLNEYNVYEMAEQYKAELDAAVRDRDSLMDTIIRADNERDAALRSRDEYIRLWQQVTAGLMDVQEERDKAVREFKLAEDERIEYVRLYEAANDEMNRWRGEYGDAVTALNDTIADNERLRAALEAFVKVYTVLYNVDRVYELNFDEQNQLDSNLRAAYDQARAALDARGGGDE